MKKYIYHYCILSQNENGSSSYEDAFVEVEKKPKTGKEAVEIRKEIIDYLGIKHENFALISFELIGESDD